MYVCMYEKEEKHALQAIMNLDKTSSHEDFKFTNVRGNELL